MNIEYYIAQLLFRYQCVTVPGFGAFLSETITANIQESNHTFYPPKKVISFNSNIINNDGLLANHIACASNTNYDLALKNIEKEVLLWKQKLETNDVLLFKDIGMLRLNSQKKIVFEPSCTVNFLTTSFGTTSFVSPAIKREEMKKEVLILEEKAPIHFTPERRQAKPYLKYAALFLLSTGGLGFGYATYINEQEKKETLWVQAQVQKEIQTKIQEATFFIDTPEIIKDSIEKSTLPFHIVAGAFRSQKNALEIYQSLVKKGFKAKILEKNDHDLYPVIYGSFVNYLEAQKQLTEIQKQENKEAWLLIKEL